jgi:hypothetical protein
MENDTDAYKYENMVAGFAASLKVDVVTHDRLYPLTRIASTAIYLIRVLFNLSEA